MEREAFERARSAYGTGAYDDATLEFVFPQLKESEDERIRKVIYKLMLGMREEIFTSQDEIVTKEKVLAYLEKPQLKEQKPVDLSEMMVHKEPYIAPVPTPMVADEQRPAEWNEEDERIRKAILGFLNPDKGGTKYSLNAELVEWSDWLKSLPERFNLQPKNEWNEEDEKWINYFYSLLGLACEKDIHGLGQKAIDAKMWLKSLRNRVGKEFLQPHWKPSEEQIKAIESCFCEFGEGCPDEDGLRSLYNDLKKLM